MQTDNCMLGYARTICLYKHGRLYCEDTLIQCCMRISGFYIYIYKSNAGNDDSIKIITEEMSCKYIPAAFGHLLYP